MRYVLVFQSSVEWWDGRRASFEPKAQSPRDHLGLPEEAVELILKGPPVEAVILAEPLEHRVVDSSAKAVPVGEGEMIWKAEMQNAWGVRAEDIEVKNLPTSSGAYLAATSRKALESLRRKRGLRRVYPLTLIIGWLARKENPTVVAFTRPGLLALGFGMGGEVREILSLSEAGEITAEMVEREVLSMVRGIASLSSLELVFLESKPPEGLALGIPVREASFSSVELPPQLAWEPASRGKAALDSRTLLALSAGLLIGLAPGFVLKQLAGRLEGELAGLQREKEQLLAQGRAVEALQRRNEELKAFLASVSEDSPLYQALRRLEELPEGILVGEAVLQARGQALTLYGKDPLALSSAVRALYRSTPPSDLQMQRTEGGWYKVSVSAAGGE